MQNKNLYTGYYSKGWMLVQCRVSKEINLFVWTDDPEKYLGVVAVWRVQK